MPKPYCYEYPRPMVTVDLVVFALEREGLRSLFIRRGKEPFAGRWAIPGGYMEIDEPIEAAARRELKEETGLDSPAHVEVIGVFGDPGRDPRGRTISIAHAAILRGPLPPVRGTDDAERAAWFDPAEALQLAFDHEEILRRAVNWLRDGTSRGPFGIALLDETFARRDVRHLLRCVVDGAEGVDSWLTRQLRSGRIEREAGMKGRYRAVATV